MQLTPPDAFRPATAGELIDAKGGARAVAARIQAEYVTVRTWKSRGVIPRRWWPEFIRCYRDVSLAMLLDIEARRGD